MNQKMKGQSMQALAMGVVILAITIGVGVVIYDAMYRGAVAERYDSESIGNTTGGTLVDQAPFTIVDTLDHSPVYFGATLADGTANATAVIVNESNLQTTLTLECCGLNVQTNNTFNISGTTVVVNSTTNGTVFVTYSVVKAPSRAHSLSFVEINDYTYSGWQLMAVSIIVAAAVAILGYLFVLGRRA